MAITLDGSAGITYPVTAGSTSAVQASSSKVLQVVNATYGTATTNNTSTYAGLPIYIVSGTGSGQVAGMGQPPGSKSGEPGVSKKKRPILKGMFKRNPPKM